MGQYINKTSKGHGIGTSYQQKVNNLIADGAYKIDPMVYEENLICVVDNGMFAAAAYCYSPAEYKVFSEPDGRPKTWLIHPQAKEMVD